VKLARVVANVVATRKDPKLEGLKFFLLEDLDGKLEPRGSIVVAADSVGCGIGELVLYASGSSARQTVQTDKRPCDATVMAIIDTIDSGAGVRLYDKVNE